MSKRDNRADHKALQTHVLRTYGDGTTAPCFDCGAQLRRAHPGEHAGPGILTLDRIQPAQFGGKYWPGNVRPACYRCNGTRVPREYALWMWRAA